MATNKVLYLLGNPHNFFCEDKHLEGRLRLVETEALLRLLPIETASKLSC